MKNSETSDKINGYSCSKQWFDFIEHHSENVNISSAHYALYSWITELNNRLHWPIEFGLPTDRTLRMTNIKSYNTYKKVLDDLILWGFVIPIKKSKNQHTANVFSLQKCQCLSMGASSNFDEAEIVASSSASSNFDTSMMKKPSLLHQILIPQNDIIKQLKTRRTIKNNKNPKREGDENIFLNKVIEEFKEAFKEKTNLNYVIIDEKNEISGAAKIAELYRREMSITDDQELLAQLKLYFREICSTKDQFLRKNLNLIFISKNINAFNLSSKSPMRKGLSQDEKDDMDQFLNI